jgi:hypothetical protein
MASPTFRLSPLPESQSSTSHQPKRLADLPAPPPAPRWIGWFLPPALLIVAVGVGGISALGPKTSLAAGIGISVLALVYSRPALAGYLVVGLTPLLAGIDRGQAVPFFRPSEAIALVVGLALAARALVGLQTGSKPRLHINRIEVAIVLMAVSNSVLPLVWLLARQHPITTDDILYALVLWKYLGIYLIVRASITTQAQVLRCLWVSVAAAFTVAVIAILQSLALFGVSALLATYYSPFGYSNLLHNSRGSSTLALPAATADLLIFNLAVLTGLWLCTRKHSVPLAIIATTFIVGTLSAGEFSSAIGLVVGIVVIALVTSYPRLLSIFVPGAAIAVVALRPVIERRLSGFDSVSGLPVSWTGRLDNLRSYFWPELFSHGNFVLGVRPAARVPVSSQGTGYVWIESGYTWLLWGGGIPLLLSFLLFSQAVISAGWRVSRHDREPTSAAGLGAATAMSVILVLMIFDPHLTYRGSAEAFFALLAMTGLAGRSSATTSAQPFKKNNPAMDAG